MKIRILLALAACVTALPAHAQPWRFEEIGNFRYRPRFDPITDRDESEAEVRTGHDRLRGVPSCISWSCHEWGLVISITASVAGDGERVRMIYRFDRDRPDTVGVTTWPQGGARSMPRELQHSFTTRARSASRLVVRPGATAASARSGARSSPSPRPCARSWGWRSASSLPTGGRRSFPWARGATPAPGCRPFWSRWGGVC